jgi:2-C-methyl-D-erythritol 2,4-cyclodiphosphate synthase
MAERRVAPVDADTVLVLERPRVAPYREEMRERLAGALGVPVECIGVKATTTEGLGFAGREEGVGAFAVVLLDRADDVSGWRCLERSRASAASGPMMV